MSQAPESQEEYVYEKSSLPTWMYIVLVVLFGGLGWLFYSGYQSRQEFSAEIAKANQRTDVVAKQLDKANSQIAELSGELKVTSEKLGLTQSELERARQFAQTIKKEQQTTAAQISAKIGEVQKQTSEQISKVSTDVGGAKSDIEATRKDLEATKGKLERSIGDMGVMSGLIARNGEELQELKRRGERNIFEFNLTKAKTPSRVGPIQVTLKKVDVKKNKYTMDVIADDVLVEKKDKGRFEPIQFYVGKGRPPYEIVVFELAKDRAVGYLSTPKN